MRKHIINYFAFDYVIDLSDRFISWTRSANIIFPLMILSGYLTIIDCFLKYIAYFLLALALFFGFVYFRIFPLKETDYKHFDDLQKYIWDIRQNKHPLSTHIPIYTRLRVFFVNPIAVLIFIILYILTA